MKKEEMLAALQMLPDADLMTASKLSDPPGHDTYYRADKVVRLLEKARADERKRIANKFKGVFACCCDAKYSGGDLAGQILKA